MGSSYTIPLDFPMLVQRSNWKFRWFFSHIAAVGSKPRLVHKSVALSPDTDFSSKKTVSIHLFFRSPPLLLIAPRRQATVRRPGIQDEGGPRPRKDQGGGEQPGWERFKILLNLVWEMYSSSFLNIFPQCVAELTQKISSLEYKVSRGEKIFPGHRKKSNGVLMSPVAYIDQKHSNEFCLGYFTLPSIFLYFFIVQLIPDTQRYLLIFWVD